jgi:hypothetical protein
MKFARLALALAAPFLLVSCLLTPGKFTSTLDVRKDRSFTFAYQGEVILLDPGAAMQEGMQEGLADGKKKPAPAKAPPPSGEESSEDKAARQAIAEGLSKEAGYRSVEYLGKDKFRVDYAMTGKLDRSFVYPLNLDAKSIIPWIVVEVRKDGSVRMTGLAFGDSDSGMGGMGGMGSAAKSEQKAREGTFTLTTDANLVMQNNEEGLAPGPGTKVVWKVTPSSRTAPTAVIRF